MSLQVPYISDDAIERDAEALLAEYAYARSVEIRAPIPIDDIIEKHLKLHVEFDDLHQLLNVPRSGFGSSPDIFGAIWLESGKIVIDESLDPEERPELEGRYRFTLAHEGGGHWRLHRSLVRTTRDQISLFEEPRPTIVCRSSQVKERVEWQADYYASCLLMPRKLVLAAWEEDFPDRKPRVLKPSSAVTHPYIEVQPLPSEFGIVESPTADDHVLEWFATPFARRFLVSPIAMRIRLEKLGLLFRELPHQQMLGGSK
jgi:Zn-dependent peptidase ImmA (M78 family)